MLIDCDSCAVRGAACAGCAVTALLETPAEIVNLSAAELYAMARAGLEPTVLAGSTGPVPLRLDVRLDTHPPIRGAGPAAGREGAA
jgi:hypothetical protein